MASNIDLLIDTAGSGILSGGSAPGGNLPELTRNDAYTFRLRLQEAPLGQIPYDVDLVGTSLKLGIGKIDSTPTDGQFRLTLSGPVTSSAISYNATTTQFFNAISGIAGNATVTAYGSTSSGWLVTAATDNTALSFGGDFFTLFPSSSVVIDTRRNPTTGVKAQQVVQLKRNPAVFSNSFSSSSTAGVVSLSKTQDGGGNKNETYRLSLGPDAVGGQFSLNFGGTSTTAIALGSPASEIQFALSGIASIGDGNVDVSSLNNSQGYSIAFVGSLANTNISTSLEIDSSGIYFIPWKVATVTMATSELDEIFSEEGTSEVELTLEIELTDGGNPNTLVQNDIIIRKDLITSGSAVPAPRESYYTKSETDSLFVEDSSTNVDATNRKLVSSDGTERLRWQGGLGFFGASAVTRQENTSVVSGLINLGLFSSSTTYGVLPRTIHTLTTTATINFGVVNANDTAAVTVSLTGARENDIILIGLPSALSAGLAFYGHVSSNDVVEIDAVNGTNTNRTQSSQTYRITAIGY